MSDEIALASSPRSVSGYLQQPEHDEYRIHCTKEQLNDNETFDLSHSCGGGGSSSSSSVAAVPKTVLQEFEQQIPNLIQLRKSMMSVDDLFCHCRDDPILKYMSHIELEEWEYCQYAHFDYSRGYTRNLIGTDHKSYTLLLLCWTPGQSSPIHDHPCDGCWMKVLQGQINECRYVENDDDSIALTCIQDMTASAGDVIYIEDAMGLHKVGNPSLTEPAMTLHLYCPPIKNCKIWCTEQHTIPKEVTICNFSEYGQRL